MKYRLADAHCDTLTTFPENPFNEEKAHWNVKKYIKSNGVLQYMAIFTPPEYTGSDAVTYVIKTIGNFIKKLPENCNLLLSKENWDESKLNIVLSLEGATPLLNSPEFLYSYYNLGIRALTLTHNHRNFLADGVGSKYGLTEFGKEMISECEKLGIIIDVSHLSDSGFDDVINYTNKAFMASHSNSRVICDVGRNLTDEQIKIIIERNGFIGINLYSQFISHNGENLTLGLTKHLEHFLDKGAENVLGLGADLDGIPEEPFIDYDGIYRVLSNVLRLNDEKIYKIMGKNLINFTLSKI